MTTSLWGINSKSAENVQTDLLILSFSRRPVAIWLELYSNRCLQLHYFRLAERDNILLRETTNASGYLCSAIPWPAFSDRLSSFFIYIHILWSFYREFIFKYNSVRICWILIIWVVSSTSAFNDSTPPTWIIRNQL